MIKALFLNAYRGLSNLRSGALDGRFGGSWRAWLIERQQAGQPAVRALWAVFTLELLALLLLQWPSSYNFSTFVFYDPGSIMRAEWLIADGLKPTIDFGFSDGCCRCCAGGWCWPSEAERPPPPT